MLPNGYCLEDELSCTRAQDIPDRSARRPVLRVQKTIIDQVLKNALPSRCHSQKVAQVKTVNFT
jgi:hypothetical protein